ncbi:MAG: 50S ribosomal protein L9 [Sphingobacteriia bacterium]|nr:50S ribosomal protein L9 [Sphingobacteriia bacterium]
MEVILLEKVNKLGNIGDTVKVKNGFGRNFLIPRGKAIRATEDNVKLFEAGKAKIAAENSQRKSEAEKSIQQLPKSVIIIRQAGEDGRLFGSVNARDIAAAINESSKVEISKTHISLTTVVKFIGQYQANVILHPEVISSININVARSLEEAELNANKEENTEE